MSQKVTKKCTIILHNNLYSQLQNPQNTIIKFEKTIAYMKYMLELLLPYQSNSASDYKAEKQAACRMIYKTREANRYKRRSQDYKLEAQIICCTSHLNWIKRKYNGLKIIQMPKRRGGGDKAKQAGNMITKKAIQTQTNTYPFLPKLSIESNSILGIGLQIPSILILRKFNNQNIVVTKSFVQVGLRVVL